VVHEREPKWWLVLRSSFRRQFTCIAHRAQPARQLSARVFCNCVNIAFAPLPPTPLTKKTSDLEQGYSFQIYEDAIDKHCRKIVDRTISANQNAAISCYIYFFLYYIQIFCFRLLRLSFTAVRVSLTVHFLLQAILNALSLWSYQFFKNRFKRI